MRKFLFIVLATALLAVTGSSGEKTTASVKELRAEIKLGTGIEKMNITGEASTFPAGTLDVWCWTKITGATEPTKVFHVWEYNGKEMAKVELEVKYPSHRTWSVKRILPEWNGEWKVTVVDESGNKIGETTFKVEKLKPITITTTPEKK